MAKAISQFVVGLLILLGAALIFWSLDMLDVFLLFILLPAIVLVAVGLLSNGTYEVLREGIRSVTTIPIREALKEALKEREQSAQ